MQKYLSRYNDKKIVVYGLGKSGLSILRFLSFGNAKFYAWDESTEARENAKKYLINKQINILNIDLFPFEEIDFLILSPGIDLNSPYNKNLKANCEKYNIEIISDIQILLDIFPEIFKIGVTGTNGKSTIVALISHILTNLGIKNHIAGNFGIPAGEVAMILMKNNKHDSAEKDVIIFELSSYQLEQIKELKLDIAALTNITPDHIDRHGSFKNYIKIKERIFKDLAQEDTAILCLNSQIMESIYQKLRKNLPSEVIAATENEAMKNMVSINENMLIDYIDGISEKDFDLEKYTNLRGKHNGLNIGIAYTACIKTLMNEKIRKVYNLKENYSQKASNIIKSLENFEGLKYRIEQVAEHNNIIFINDSKATNIAATAKAIEAFDNIIWLAGGILKEDLENDNALQEIFTHKKHIHTAIFFGKNGSEFFNAVDKTNNKDEIYLEKTDVIDNAFKIAIDVTRNLVNLGKKPVILFSPACASFDQFKNFEQRGEYFNKLVKDYIYLNYVA